MTKLLPTSDFRSQREILEPKDFAIGPRREPKPSDLITLEDWRELMILPDDVAIRTSNHNGTRLRQLIKLWSEWLDVVGDDPGELVYGPILDAADDFQAATFNGLHGYYCQAISGLRSACESISISATCQAMSLLSDYNSWRGAKKELKYGWACDKLSSHLPIQQLEDKVFNSVGDSVFRQKTASTLGGWARRAYYSLSNYVHAKPSFTNVDFWASNGPIYDQKAFIRLWQIFIEVTALCHLFIAFARVNYSVPSIARQAILPRRSSWSRVAKSAFRFRGAL